MIRLLLSCDEYIYRINGKYYAGSESRKEFLTRYLRVFDKVRYVLRCIDEEELKPGRALLEDDRIDVVPVPIFHGPVQYAKSILKVRKSVSGVTGGCDAAILRLPSTVGQLISKEIISKGIPYAVEVVFDAHDGAETANNVIERTLWRVIDRKMRHICKKADGVSCVTERYLQRRYFSKKANHFEGSYSTLNLEKSFFSAPRSFPNKDVLTIAHVDLQIGLHSRKGTDIIIRALSKVKKERNITINVMFAGDDWDNSKEKIMNFAKKYGIEGQVDCPGLLSRTELSSFLDKSDLFVLPTKAEGLPRVIIEAIAKGLPTITTPVSGNPELISEDYLVSFYDVDTLADKIERLVTDKNEYERVSKRNYEHSLQFEGSILQDRRDEFYRKLKALTE